MLISAVNCHSHCDFLLVGCPLKCFPSFIFVVLLLARCRQYAQLLINILTRSFLLLSEIEHFHFERMPQGHHEFILVQWQRISTMRHLWSFNNNFKSNTEATYEAATLIDDEYRSNGSAYFQMKPLEKFQSVPNIPYIFQKSFFNCAFLLVCGTSAFPLLWYSWGWVNFHYNETTWVTFEI